MTDFNPHGRVAIVTGASSGIGRDLVTTLLDRGYRVVANARTIIERQIFNASERLALVEGDVANPATAKAIFDAAMAMGGRIDLLVNNAGVFIPNAFEDFTAAEFEAMVGTNLAGFFYTTQPVVRQMKAQGSGHIVTLSTTLANQPVAGLNAALTSLTKGGLNAATRELAIELVGHGIRVNAIAAGIIDTPMHAPEGHAYLASLHPMNRLGTIDEIIHAVTYLEEAGFVTGELLNVDGGAHAGKW